MHLIFHKIFDFRFIALYKTTMNFTVLYCHFLLYHIMLQRMTSEMHVCSDSLEEKLSNGRKSPAELGLE